MSVIIEDMDIPKNCCLCNLAWDWHGDGDIWCPWGNCTVNQHKDKRADWCPLKENSSD